MSPEQLEQAIEHSNHPDTQACAPSREELRRRLKGKLNGMQSNRQRTGKHSLPPASKAKKSSPPEPPQDAASPSPTGSLNPADLLNDSKLNEFIRTLKKDGSEQAVESLGIPHEGLKKALAGQLKGRKGKVLNPQMIRSLIERALQQQEQAARNHALLQENEVSQETNAPDPV